MQDTNKMENERKLYCKFIDMYKSLPSLWKVKSEEYSNRVKKNSDYELLLQTFRQINPIATKENMVKKINCMRTSYRRELKKKRNHEKSGADYTFVPTIWYFNRLSFLESQVKHVCTTEDEEEEEDPIEVFVSRPKRNKRSDEVNLVEMPHSNLGNGKRTSDADTISKSWGSQYDQMEVSQQIIARKLISDVLFHGCVGSLEMRHVVQVENVFNEEYTPAQNYMPQHQIIRRSESIPQPKSPKYSVVCRSSGSFEY